MKERKQSVASALSKARSFKHSQTTVQAASTLVAHSELCTSTQSQKLP